jgi:hypothetical protein
VTHLGVRKGSHESTTDLIFIFNPNDKDVQISISSEGDGYGNAGPKEFLLDSQHSREPVSFVSKGLPEMVVKARKPPRQQAVDI